MRKQHLYISVYFELFNPTRFIKVYFIFSALMLVFAIRILYPCIKNRTPGLSLPHHLAFGQRDDDTPCEPAQGRQKLYDGEP